MRDTRFYVLEIDGEEIGEFHNLLSLGLELVDRVRSRVGAELPSSAEIKVTRTTRTHRQEGTDDG